MKELNYAELTDEELRELALEKRSNGNGSSRAYKAQHELAKRHDPIQLHSTRSDGSTKRFAYNRDYMNFETDNR